MKKFLGFLGIVALLFFGSMIISAGGPWPTPGSESCSIVFPEVVVEVNTSTTELAE
ncbi:MAG: hypothetical protein KAX49_09980 [Halanaerobiales bacterium]|nr:hypothetical protein [Halanaerobiales bacterium]